MAKKKADTALRRALEESTSADRVAPQKDKGISMRVTKQEHDSISMAAGAEKMTITDYLLACHFAHVKGKKLVKELG